MPPTVGLLIFSLLLFETAAFTNGHGVVPPGNFSTLPRSRHSLDFNRLIKDGAFRSNSNGNGGKELYIRWNDETPANSALTSRTRRTPQTQSRVACDNGWTHADQFNACYMVIRTGMAGKDGEQACRREGGHLVSIHSKEENDFVTALVNVTDGWILIGLTIIRSEKTFSWTDGTWKDSSKEWYNSNWADESCVSINPFVPPHEWSAGVCIIWADNLVCKKEAFKAAAKIKSTLPRSRRSMDAVSLIITSRMAESVDVDCSRGDVRNTMKMTNGTSANWHIKGSDVGQFKCHMYYSDAFVVLRAEGGSSAYFLEKDGVFRSNPNGKGGKELYTRWNDERSLNSTPAPQEPKSTPQTQPRVACDNGWTPAGQFNACYKVIPDKEARNGEDTCIHEGGHLVSIHSKEENDFVGALVKTSKWILIGLQISQDEKRASWTDGTGKDSSKEWYNNHWWSQSCVFMARSSSYKWATDPCNSTKCTLVCKKEAIKVE